MQNYNGMYEQCLEVIISAKSHEACLTVAQKIFHLCKAWSHNVRYNEYKSARKGDVLKRDILIYQTAYARDIITFRESLECICFHYGLYHNISVENRSTIPKDRRKDLGVIE